MKIALQVVKAIAIILVVTAIYMKGKEHGWKECYVEATK
jgi:hypothetical protein